MAATKLELIENRRSELQAAFLAFGSVSEQLEGAFESLRGQVAQLRADLRDYPRYDIDAKAHVGADSRSIDIRVFDISESGARIAKVEGIAVGTKLVLTFHGLDPVAGRIIREAEDSFGLCFEPQKLKTDEVRRLIAAAAA